MSKPREFTLHLLDGYFVEGITLTSKNTIHVREVLRGNDELEARLKDAEASIDELKLKNQELRHEIKMQLGSDQFVVREKLENSIKELERQVKTQARNIEYHMTKSEKQEEALKEIARHKDYIESELELRWRYEYIAKTALGEKAEVSDDCENPDHEMIPHAGCEACDLWAKKYKR